MSNICKERFLEGIQDRNKYPLSNGIYKIKQVNDLINDRMDRLIWIAALKQKKVRPNWYDPNPSKENTRWIKNLPLDLAYNLGFRLKPGIEALGGDGVSPKAVALIKRDFFPCIERRVDNCERVYAANRNNIKNEYNDMIVGRLSPTQLLTFWIGESARNILVYLREDDY
jgi:hypothetical protein